jgi:hypothetical protein
VTSLAERTSSLSARLPAERTRTLHEVRLVMVDGTEVRGMLHCAQGTRTLDFLNKQTEAFVAMTDATLYHGEDCEDVPFIALNKLHILRVIEAEDLD